MRSPKARNADASVGNTESRLHAHAQMTGCYGQGGRVVTRVSADGDHCVTPWRRAAKGPKIDDRSFTVPGWAVWRRSAIAHHVPAPRAQAAEPVQPPLCACGVPSAPARRKHRSAVRSGQVVQDAISVMALRLVVCPATDSCSGLGGRTEHVVICRAQSRWLGRCLSEAHPRRGKNAAQTGSTVPAQRRNVIIMEIKCSVAAVVLK